MTSQTTPRVFRYNAVELEDPGPEHDPVDVRNLYSATYPEIVSAAIDGPEEKDGKRVYTFRKAIGTKGAAAAAVRARLERVVRGERLPAGGAIPPEFVRAQQAAFTPWAEFTAASLHGDGEPLDAPAELLTPTA